MAMSAISNSFSPQVDRAPVVCGCGQDLDLVVGDHCTRCGTQLGSVVDDSGFWWAA
jgi:hypothetical protein